MIVPAGSLDDDPGIRPRYNIFWESRAPWYEEGCAAEAAIGYPKGF